MNVQWCVWCLYPWQKEWIADYQTVSNSRSIAIHKFDSTWVLPNQYRKKRRRGVAKCIRTNLTPAQPELLR